MEGGAQYGTSETGALAYISGGDRSPHLPGGLGRPGQGGASLWSEDGSYAHPRLSPNGKKLALSVLRDGNWDIWVYDLEREVATRLTFGEGYDGDQVWSPDGSELLFTSDRGAGW